MPIGKFAHYRVQVEILQFDNTGLIEKEILLDYLNSAERLEERK